MTHDTIEVIQRRMDKYKRRQALKRNPPKRPRAKRRNTYGPGSRVNDTQKMHRAQLGRCANAGCAAVIAPLGRGRALDRDPSTGKPLAILCKACSVALGVTRRNPLVLRGLLEYILIHK